MGKIDPWGGVLGKTDPWGGVFGKIEPWGGLFGKTGPWGGALGKTDPMGGVFGKSGLCGGVLVIIVGLLVGIIGMKGVFCPGKKSEGRDGLWEGGFWLGGLRGLPSEGFGRDPGGGNRSLGKKGL